MLGCRRTLTVQSDLKKLCGILFLSGGLCLPALAQEPVHSQVLRLDLDSGRQLVATLRIPTEAKGRLPVVMLFGGFQDAAEVLDLVHTPVPLIWASFDYPYDPPRKFIFPNALGHLPAFKQAVADTFDGIAKLNAALRVHPRVDPARISIAGASAGAPFAVIGGARNQIPGVIIVQGFADLPRVIAFQLERRWVPDYGEWTRWPASWLAHLLVWGLDLPEPGDYAPQLTGNQRALMVTAAEDDMIPPESTAALWAALQTSGATAEKIQLPGGHLRGSRTGLIARIIEVSLDWLQQQGLLPAHNE